MLLVDADEPEPWHGSEDRGAGADDDRCLAGDDALPLVAPLGVGQPGVQDGDAIAEAGLEAPERLRRQRDLGDEHDRAAAAGQRRRARLQVDLCLAAPRRPREEQMGAVSVHRLDDPRDGAPLWLRQLLRLRFAGHALPGHPPLAAPRAELRCDELQRPRRRRAVVVGDPQREIDERGRQLVEQRPDRRGLDACGAPPPRSRRRRRAPRSDRSGSRRRLPCRCRPAPRT